MENDLVPCTTFTVDHPWILCLMLGTKVFREGTKMENSMLIAADP